MYSSISINEITVCNNMHIHIDLIAGLPYENIESFERSFDIGYSLGANMLQMGFLKLLHGADMREQPKKYPCEFSSEPPYEVISTPWLSEEELKMLKNCEDALDRLYNSGRFLITLEYLIEEVGISPFNLFNDFGHILRHKNITCPNGFLTVEKHFTENGIGHYNFSCFLGFFKVA